MSEKYYQEESNLLDVSDIANESDIYEVERDSEFRIDDIGLNPQIKLLFLLFCLIGFGFSVLYLGIYPIFIWGLVIIFVMDLMGMLDSLERFFNESGKPRGRYESIG